MTLHLPCICNTFTPVGRPPLEETKTTSLRFPVRLWRLVEQAAKDRNVSVNGLIWQLMEDFLESAKYLKLGERKRPKVRRKPE